MARDKSFGKRLQRQPREIETRKRSQKTQVEKEEVALFSCHDGKSQSCV